MSIMLFAIAVLPTLAAGSDGGLTGYVDKELSSVGGTVGEWLSGRSVRGP